MTKLFDTFKRYMRIAAGATLLSSCTIATSEDSRFEGAGRTSSEARETAGIAAAIQNQIETGQIPGAVVMIARHGEIVDLVSRGYADLENQVPIQQDTIFRFYSMSKPITCAAVMTLYDDGLIGLDDPIKDYLPELSKMQVRTPDGLVPAKSDITIRNLMTHTSGFAYAVLPNPAQQDYIDANVFAIKNRLTESLEQHVKRLAQMPLVAEPGTKWNYGESMGVLGRLVEVVSGKTYGNYLQDRIFDPLNMIDTGFYVPASKSDRLAQLYHMSNEGVLSNANDDIQYGGSYLEKPQLEYGGAGLVGTPRDYMSFANMLLNKGSSNGRRILSQQAVEMMTTNQLDASFGDSPLEAAGRGPGTGFGFCGLVTVALPEGSDPGSVGEYGWSGWASTNFWMDPANDLIGLVFTQVIPDDIGSIMLSHNVREVIYSSDSDQRE
ncbi:serine hydrolase [Hyphomonas sp. ND6WE1B]|uniref:serine hydrolase domain-containing protein n=1 Tax=Hyphomonas sp. ND6WE1B TaxID=1848191 RepID=UPI00080768D9|nr:serine hydrolase domain-containing protein [Hyphomonas sp. ND6WE1B]